jgi:hypothetical protein
MPVLREDRPMLGLVLVGAAGFGLGACVMRRWLNRPLRIDQRRRPTMIEPYRRRRYARLQRRDEEEG